MAERSKFQFRMRDLIWAVSLIGVALALELGPTTREPHFSDAVELAALVAAVLGKHACCGAVVGAGIGCLFQSPKLGAALGAAVAVAGGLLYLVVATERYMQL